MATGPVRRGELMPRPEIVIFTEEFSMKTLIESIWPRIPKSDAVSLKCIPHQGVSDLLRSLPRKLKAWRNPNARFLILRDNDNGDCCERKEQLIEICQTASRLEQCKVRIVCQELEAWFLGDLAAIDRASLTKRPVRRKQSQTPYREPDTIQDPIRSLDRLLKKDIVAAQQKIIIAKAIGPEMDLDHNNSVSFNHTIDAICALIEDVAPER